MDDEFASPIVEKLRNYGKNGKKHPIKGDEIGNLLRGYRNFLDLLPKTKKVALLEPSGSRHKGERRPLTHEVLHNFIANEFDLSKFGLPLGTRIGVLVPNGPELATCIVGVVSRWCCVPINPANTWQEIKFELENTKAQAIIVQAGVAHESALYAAGSLSLGVLELHPSDDICGLFTLSVEKKISLKVSHWTMHVATQTIPQYITYDHPETVLLLHTSGTSGTKKLVPYSLDMLIIGVGCIISSWNLNARDVCLNMMPLFHIGGIVRNIFSPILAGACVIPCVAFDPILFWDILSMQRVTNYYAAPTMHHAILVESELRPRPLPVSTMRYVANAAGGLLPILADALKATFHSAVILTSYGMTECMPIASPPQDYALDPTGTSGTIVGPQVIIVSDEKSKCDVNETGRIMIRGPPCFGGYENNDAATDEAFSIVDGDPGWFDTGDVGYLDLNGYLFISGRSKEIINRGGETISPFEIEEAVLQHPFVGEALAFSAPHKEYQETVGIAVVPKPGKPRVDLASLQSFVEDKIHRSKWPQVVVYMTALPKNTANKLLRINMAQRMSLESIDEDSTIASRQFEAPECPPVGADLSYPIDLVLIKPSPTDAIKLLEAESSVATVVIFNMKLPSKGYCFVACVTPETANTVELQKLCLQSLHGYHVPTFICAISQLPTIKNSNHKSSKSLVGLSLNASEEEDLLGGYSYGYGGSHIHTDFVIGGKAAAFLLRDRSIDDARIRQTILQLYSAANVVRPRDELESVIEKVWRKVLPTTSNSVISVNDSFFNIGGDSLKAGQMINAMRKRLSIQGLTVSDLFAGPTIAAIAKRVVMLGYKLPVDPAIQNIQAQMAAQADPRVAGSSNFLNGSIGHNDHILRGGPPMDGGSKGIGGSPLSNDELNSFPRYASDYPDEDAWNTPSVESSPTSCFALVVQLIPLALLYPFKRMSVWFFVAQPWVLLMDAGVDRLLALVLAMMISRLLTYIVSPMFAICMKWLIIGRYKPGRYPIWGTMYLRWWLVEQTIEIMGKGIFSGENPIIGPFMVVQYYRMMGARIGANVRMSKGCKIGQPDLITIEDNVVLDDAILSPFSLCERHFVMLPIRICRDSSVGIKSSIAAGVTIPSNTQIGPLSSSHELDDARQSNRRYCRPLLQGPPLRLMILIGMPILGMVTILSYIPWYVVLIDMEYRARKYGWYVEKIHTIFDAFSWWCSPQRLPYYFLLRILRRCVVPPLRLVVVILVKRLFIGKFEPCDKVEMNIPWNRFRYWLMDNLLPGRDLGGVANLAGRHYEFISAIYRLLGAKVGKRVYWPGSGFDVVEYDLLHIGDDVVFGSRSILITRSTERAGMLIIEDSAMLSDRCVALPNSRMGKGSVLGSGGLAAEDHSYPMGSVWVGSQKGNAVNVLPEDYSIRSKSLRSAFGEAFYDGKANFFVFPLWFVVFYNTAWQVFCSIFHNLAPVVAIYASMYIGQVNSDSWISEVVKIILLYSVPAYAMLNVVALCIDIAAKWCLLGLRKPGKYPWNTSSYCQRWQVYLTIQEIRRGESGETGVLDLLQGTQYLVWYFRSLGSKIGHAVCLYPNGGDPMMSEPDLVTIGDYASIDNASLISHINTRGIFSLNALTVARGCVLKSNSRLLSGASMERNSILLEHTLILSGDSVDTRTVWQGWPSKSQISLEDYRVELQSQILRFTIFKPNVPRGNYFCSWMFRMIAHSNDSHELEMSEADTNSSVNPGDDGGDEISSLSEISSVSSRTNRSGRRFWVASSVAGSNNAGATAFGYHGSRQSQNMMTVKGKNVNHKAGWWRGEDGTSGRQVNEQSPLLSTV